MNRSAQRLYLEQYHDLAHQLFQSQDDSFPEKLEIVVQICEYIHALPDLEHRPFYEWELKFSNVLLPIFRIHSIACARATRSIGRGSRDSQSHELDDTSVGNFIRYLLKWTPREYTMLTDEAVEILHDMDALCQSDDSMRVFIGLELQCVMAKVSGARASYTGKIGPVQITDAVAKLRGAEDSFSACPALFGIAAICQHCSGQKAMLRHRAPHEVVALMFRLAGNPEGVKLPLMLQHASENVLAQHPTAYQVAIHSKPLPSWVDSSQCESMFIDAAASSCNPGPEAATVSGALRKCLIGFTTTKAGLDMLVEADVVHAISSVIELYQHESDCCTLGMSTFLGGACEWFLETLLSVACAAFADSPESKLQHLFCIVAIGRKNTEDSNARCGRMSFPREELYRRGFKDRWAYEECKKLLNDLTKQLRIVMQNFRQNSEATGRIGTKVIERHIRPLYDKLPNACSAIDCNRAETAGTKFLICSGCRIVRYCSRRCQSLHWRARHKYDCRACNGVAACAVREVVTHAVEHLLPNERGPTTLSASAGACGGKKGVSQFLTCPEWQAVGCCSKKWKTLHSD